MAQKSNLTRSPTSRTLAVLCLLPVPAGPREDPGRDGIRRGGFCHFKSGARRNRAGGPAPGVFVAGEGNPCCGVELLQPSLAVGSFLEKSRRPHGLLLPLGSRSK